MRKITITKMLTVVTSIFLLFSLSACSNVENKTAKNPNAIGTILLSVNPEIEMNYDKNGTVLEVTGINKDGQSVLDGYDCTGKSCDTVVNELVTKIHEEGYFEKTVDGHTKNIVIKLEAGSTYPNENFLEHIADSSRNAVNEQGTQANTMLVEEKDLDEHGRIGIEKARAIVLAQLGLADATFKEAEYDLTDNVYEFEFTNADISYEYEVDAINGKVLKADFEHNDDWDVLNDADEPDDDTNDLDDVDEPDDDDTNDIDDADEPDDDDR